MKEREREWRDALEELGPYQEELRRRRGPTSEGASPPGL